MVGLSSMYPTCNHLGTSPPKGLKHESTPITMATIHQLWTEALVPNPPSMSLSLAHLKRLIRTLNLTPLLTPVQISPLYLNIALILAFLGEYFLAAESFQKALALDPKSTIGWYGLGGMNFLLGDWDSARKSWTICSICFGNKTNVKYRVWKIGGNETEEEISRDRRWVLDRAKVDWNLNFASLGKTPELEQQKHKIWDVSGIPAGLAFGPSFSAVDSDSFIKSGSNSFRIEDFPGKTTLVQHIAVKKLPDSTQTSAATPQCYTKPLPALPAPVRTASTPSSVHRNQKGFAIARLFNKPRTFSAPKSQGLRSKRRQLVAEPVSCYDLADISPVFESNLFRDSSTVAGNGIWDTESQGLDTFVNTAITDLDLLPSVFDTESDSNDDTDALAYYFSPSTAQTPKGKHAASPASETLVSPQPFPQRTSSLNPAGVSTPVLEARNQELSPPTLVSKGRDLITKTKTTAVGSESQDMKQKACSTRTKTIEQKGKGLEVDETKRNEITPKTSSKSDTEEMRSQTLRVRTRSEILPAIVMSATRRRQIENDKAFVRREIAKLEQARLEQEKAAPSELTSAKQEPFKHARVKQQQQQQQPQPSELWPAALRLHKPQQPAQSELTKQELTTLKPVILLKSTKPELPKPFPIQSQHPATTATTYPTPAKLKPLTQLDPTLEYLSPVRFEGFGGEWRDADRAWEHTLKMRALKAVEGTL